MRKKPKHKFKPSVYFYLFLLLPAIAIGLFFGFRKTIADASVNTRIESLTVENNSLKGENSKWQKLYFDMYNVQEDYRSTVKQIADLMLYTNMGTGGTTSIPPIKASNEMTLKYAQQAYNVSKDFLDGVYGLKDWTEKFNNYYSNSPFIYPIKTDGTVKLSSAYGLRESPLPQDKGKLAFHPGVDLVGKVGDPIQATANGIVKWIELDNPIYGQLVIISHELGFETWYGHMSKIFVKIDQTVKQGAVIGLMGETGEATGPHLHYEIHLGPKTLDPMYFLSL